MRMKVADKRDWFAVEGGAEVDGEVVPLAMLLAAIREGRRYVPVGARGFVRIEETLREALARAEAVAVRAARRRSQLAGRWRAIRWWAWSRRRRRSRRAPRSRRCGGACARGRRRAPLQLPAGAGGDAAPVPEGGRRLAGPPGPLGRGRDPGRRDGPGQDRADAGGAGPPGAAAARRWWWRRPRWSPTGSTEAARFAPELKVRLYRGADREAALAGLGPGDLVVTSYAIAALDAEALAAIHLRLAGAGRGAGGEERHHRAGQGPARRWTPSGGWRLTGTPDREPPGRAVEPAAGDLAGPARAAGSSSAAATPSRSRSSATTAGAEGAGGAAAPVRAAADQGRGGARAAGAHRDRAHGAPVARGAGALRAAARSRPLEEIAAGARRIPTATPATCAFVLLAALTRLRQLCCHPRLVYPRTARRLVQGRLPAGAAGRAARGRAQGAGVQPVPQLPGPAGAAPAAARPARAGAGRHHARRRRASSGSPPSRRARPTSS